MTNFKNDMDHKRKELLREWRQNTFIAKSVHYEHSKFFRVINNAIVSFNVGFAALIGTSAIADLSPSFQEGLPNKMLAIISVSVAVLTSIQNHFKLGEVSERHRLLGAEYSGVERKIQSFLADDSLSQNKLEEVRVEYSDLVSKSPTTVNYIYKYVKKRVAREC